MNSTRTIQFTQWAINILPDFAILGYVLDKERLKNGAFFNKTYFDNLLEDNPKASFAIYLYQGLLDYDENNKILFLPAWMG